MYRIYLQLVEQVPGDMGFHLYGQRHVHCPILIQSTIKRFYVMLSANFSVLTRSFLELSHC